jgi:hypothetical protein
MTRDPLLTVASGAWGGQRLRMGNYVTEREATAGAHAARAF